MKQNFHTISTLVKQIALHESLKVTPNPQPAFPISRNKAVLAKNDIKQAVFFYLKVQEIAKQYLNYLKAKKNNSFFILFA